MKKSQYVVRMTIPKKKIEQAIVLKRLYSKKLTDLAAGDAPLGTVLPRDAEKVMEQRAQIEGSDVFCRLKEFLEGLSEKEFQELQAVAFYGRSQYPMFAKALEEANPGRRDEEIQYTMNLIAAADYLEAGFEKLNLRHEI